ncbi:hypothetical protein LEP1GSC116_2344 [Leptospira interrogans serovar Icterohaemorrhagiae str. Verdun HP]|uniref:Uncharacterized protein n=1 Tax=Leptospira interrogans serovar Icterohaemorrhagiae str. Verdun HP TaxID=1049910 RepID=M6RFV7_LEPIR|nr:hypothetical protein LEP1GSC148_0770 [Leptospira interrogans serovar Canicola str. LT1962]EMO07052.1 hypothetical protein LEP1GSC116_2344 [Leptospira interrogans serovar Icterohaemorrhagiae str. Verdun HP]
MDLSAKRLNVIEPSPTLVITAKANELKKREKILLVLEPVSRILKLHLISETLQKMQSIGE